MVRIYELTGPVTGNTAYCLATQYRIVGGFVPEKVFVFETENNDLEVLKKLIDEYFALVVKTDLYVKEVPSNSTLFSQEAERLYGTVSIICSGGTE